MGNQCLKWSFIRDYFRYFIYMIIRDDMLMINRKKREVVQKDVRLRFDDDVMAIVVLNTPSFFDTTYKEWLQRQYEVGESMEHFANKIGPHPIRSFFLSRFADVEDKLTPIRAVSICDFEPLYDRLPLVSLPVCGHVSGAAYFYRVNEAIDPRTGKRKLHMGLSLHHKYGGHFSFRGVIVFPDVHLLATYKEQQPLKTLHTEEEIERALQLFNEYFFDNRYRDCGAPIERYSELQLKYFSTPPERRWSLIAHWFRN
ncbi:MMACHC-like protein [Toxocara canis]|uniref:Cyanocobalamin reductase (cyanide-eliminating) n=1 Tax=Toxocara canis TaxID=6265 RepID=A0A0B2URK5_TOXCA|nr:MMACHC-like protein [Toxocara canis]